MSKVQRNFSSLSLRVLTVTMTLFMASSLAGCDLYFGEGPIVEPEPEYLGPDGSFEEWPDGGGDGWLCETNDNCASGCFCTDDNWCEESGFCESNNDCFDGFHCDERSTCVPDGEPEPEPEPTCSDLDAQETACIAAETCSPVYRGVNCTSDTGVECTAGAESCSCESFVLDRCEEISDGL